MLGRTLRICSLFSESFRYIYWYFQGNYICFSFAYTQSTAKLALNSILSMSGTLAVISQSGHSLSFYDLTSGTLTSRLTNLIAEPHELCFDSERNLLYISHAYRHGNFWAHGENGHEISVIDLSKSSPEVTDTISIKPSLGPHGLLLDSANDTLYVSFEESDGDKKGGVLGLNLYT